MAALAVLGQDPYRALLLRSLVSALFTGTTFQEDKSLEDTVLYSIAKPPVKCDPVATEEVWLSEYLSMSQTRKANKAQHEHSFAL